MKKLVKFITSFFYLGYSPFMPGTVGSAGGVALYFLFKDNDILYAFSLVFLFILGMIFVGKAEEIYKMKDASAIVIDEVCGMLLALFMVPYSMYAVITGFLIFRILDIIKPPPAKMIERLAGSAGVMLDDIVVAVYTNIVLQIIFRYLNIVKV